MLTPEARYEENAAPLGRLCLRRGGLGCLYSRAMQCPVDQAVLQMTERQGVEIDYCPQCRGVWLDRGELDKIIDRSVDIQGAPAPSASPQAPQYDDRGRDRSFSDPRSHKKKRKESLLGELFDF